MRRYLCFLLSVFAAKTVLRVEVRNSEVWLIRDGREYELTHDGKSKFQAELSTGQNRIAYYEECTVAENCTPTVVILDLEGHRVDSFQPRHQAVPPAEPCSSILSIAWVGDNSVATICHINPSRSEYIETNLTTRRTVRDLLGYNFVVSPDGKGVAHVGGIPHFAPPYAQSNYLQIDNVTVYPLPRGIGPVEQKDLAEPPNVVDQEDLTYVGIHEFEPQMSWSPDSRRIALVDCTYDWTANRPGSLSAGDGVESNRKCSLAVVSSKGEATLFPLKEMTSDDLVKLRLSWISSKQLSLETHNATERFTVP